MQIGNIDVNVQSEAKLDFPLGRNVKTMNKLKRRDGFRIKKGCSSESVLIETSPDRKGFKCI